LTYPSEKYEFVSWDYDIPNVWNKNMFQTTKQNMFLASAGVVAMDWCFETTNSTNGSVSKPYPPGEHQNSW